MRDGFIKVAAASPSLKVGNPSFNKERIIDLMTEADRKGVKVLVFPELSITGYTAGDLFFQSALLESATEALLEIAEASAALDVLSFVGYPLRYASAPLRYDCPSPQIVIAYKSDIGSYDIRAYQSLELRD